MTRPVILYGMALAMQLAVAAVQAACMPSSLGPPCARGGIASASQAEPELSLAAGNPIHLVTGNNYQTDIDLPANPTAPGLEIIRHYNSMDTLPSLLGQGWTLSYDTQLFRVASGWQIVQADGQRIDFPDHATDPNGHQRTRHGRLDHVNDHHNWFWHSGVVLRFDPGGRLLAIRWPNGESVHIQRHAEAGPLQGAIRTVQNDRGHSMAFHYAVHDDLPLRLIAIDTPLGRFHYDHDIPPEHAAPRLVRITRPDAMQRHYLHEPELQAGHTYALTGIAIGSSDASVTQRLNTWAYDDKGRAIRSIRGAPDSQHELVQLDYRQSPDTHQPGLTVVRNAQQRDTYFHTAIKGGRYVLTQVDGAGCPGCAAPGAKAVYDDAGRLQEINGTRIVRTPKGHLQALHPAHSGWPGLRLHYTDSGLRERWFAEASGLETIQYNSHNLPAVRRFANGDTVTISYDIQHRPITIREQHGQDHATTRLSWYGQHLTHIDHPSESETRHYDERGRLTQRSITRPPSAARGALHYSEQFDYDPQDRLVRHHLPEGGRLDYEWGQGPQLQAIYWHDIHGKRHTIIKTIHGQPGYRYGNGLHLAARTDSQDRVRQLQVRHGTDTIWTQHLDYDANQRIVTETIRTPGQGVFASNYAYTPDARLIGARREHTAPDASQPSRSHTDWFAWQASGAAAAQRRDAHTLHPVLQHDPSGLPRHADGYDLEYGPGRRLNRISRHGQTLARYQHNGFGYRISRQDAHQAQTDYLYLNNQLVAQTGHTAASMVSRRYVYAHHVPVGLIDYTADTPAGQVYAIHADLRGAPRLLTDHSRQIRWQADYSPLGQARTLAGDMSLALRLPGQIEDPDTGWHDNLLRTYLPQWGHYLEPDPLGPVPGNQAYGYAAQQPQRHADPMGLLLFAFDGTRQSPATQSNVWKMAQQYLDGPVYYNVGPGNSDHINWDALTAHQASQIIDIQWKRLLRELSRPQATADVIPIDILGFSRGAALARHFGNLIQQHVSQGMFQLNDPHYGSLSVCVDLRFMGLFDTVAQFGVGGIQNRNYDLSIAPAWEWVAHAVALHERRWLFPVTIASDAGGVNIVEAPFIGAHSDIGGGILPDQRGQPGGRGDLSNVALQWMLWQAQAASVPFAQPDATDGNVSQPILHDFRSILSRYIQNGDRSVQTTGASPGFNYQDDHPRLGRTLRQQTETLIQREPGWQQSGNVEVGRVDMEGYTQWLHDELGWHALPV